MRLVEYEELIKKQIEEDRSNPEIYNNLQQMIEMFLRRKKVCHCSSDYKDMSFMIAGDIFMKITEGEDIYHYLGYFEKVYRRYASEYFRDEHSEVFNFDDTRSIDLQDAFYGKPSFYDYDSLVSRIYLEDIGRVVDEVMQQSCKYDMMSSSFMNLKLSLVLSLLRGEEVSFHLNKEQQFYLKLILTNFYNKVVKEGFGLGDNP